MKSSALTQAGLDRLHQAMAARVENRSLPGIVTLGAQGDDVYVDVIGSMAFGGDRPMRRDTIFRITSMTKPILGAATMLLVDDGRLALGEPVSRLLPELAARRVLKRVDGPLDQTVPANCPITVEDLLTFRPGYGFIIVVPTTFNPPYPIIQRAEELQLAHGAAGPPHAARPRRVDRPLRNAAADVPARRALAVQRRLARARRPGRPGGGPATGRLSPGSPLRAARHARHRLRHACRPGRPAANRVRDRLLHREDGRGDDHRPGRVAHAAAFPLRGGRPAVDGGRLPGVRRAAPRPGRAPGPEAAVRGVARRDDHQPPHARADRGRRRPARRPGLGILPGRLG